MERSKGFRTTAAVALGIAWLAVVTGVCMGAQDDWVLVDSDPATSDFLYNSATVGRGTKGIVTVETKAVYSEDGKADALEVLDAARYAHLAYTLFVYDIDCAGEESLLKRVVHYDDQGARIAAFDLTGKSAWEDIPMDSRLEKVQQAECR
jgi:hypothetical protein